MLYNEPSPLETKVLTRLFGVPNSTSVETYVAHEALSHSKAVTMTPEAIIDEVKSRICGGGEAPDSPLG